MNISSKTLKLLYVLIVVFLGIMAVIWFSGIFFTESQEFEARLFTSIVVTSMAFVAGIFLLYLGIMYKMSTAVGKMWFLLGLGILLFGVGEFIYSYYDIFTDIAPSPSPADVFYLGAYVPLTIGFIKQMKLTPISMSKNEKILISVVFGTICTVVVIFVIIPILSFELTFEYFVWALYPLVDLVVIICILVVFMKLRHGKINTAWMLILLGFLAMAMADIIFDVNEINGIYSIMEPYDYLFMAAYTLMLAGTLSIISLMTKTFAAQEKK